MHDDASKTLEAHVQRVGGDIGVQQTAPLITFPLRDSHRIGEFRCAKSPAVADFLQNKARDQIKKNFCRVFVLENPSDRDQVWGFYSLSAFQISRDIMVRKHKNTLGRSSAPMVLLGYMGRTDGLEPGRYGAWLVQDAARRAFQIGQGLGIWGLMVEAENSRLAEWYGHADIGFIKCTASLAPDRPLLYAPLATLVPELHA